MKNGEHNLVVRSFRFDSGFFKQPKVSLVGFVCIAVYCIFTFISFTLFPSAFTPVNNNLSELGDFYDNPNGAIFFNLGMILSGFLIIIFYIGLYKWFMNIQKSKLHVTALIAGTVNALAVIMAGIFSETKETFPQHVFWSNLIFLSFFPILILTNTSIITFTDFNNIVAFYGFAVSLIDLTFLVLLTSTGVEANFPLIEWVSVFSYISWIGVLSFFHLKIGVQDET